MISAHPDSPNRQTDSFGYPTALPPPELDAACLPQRVSQVQSMGPYRDTPEDFELFTGEYYKAMGLDTETGPHY